MKIGKGKKRRTGEAGLLSQSFMEVLLDLGEILDHRLYCCSLPPFTVSKVLRAETEVKAASVPHVAGAPEEGKSE